MTYKKWTKEELEILTKYRDKTALEISGLINRTPKAINKKRRKLLGNKQKKRGAQTKITRASISRISKLPLEARREIYSEIDSLHDNNCIGCEIKAQYSAYVCHVECEIGLKIRELGKRLEGVS